MTTLAVTDTVETKQVLDARDARENIFLVLVFTTVSLVLVGLLLRWVRG